jgi:uncharacterized membrane protein
MTKLRLEAFSDAVFAVAITILALDLKVPGADVLARHHGLWGAVRFDWPTYAAYATSFVVIGIIWISHNGVLRHIEAIDRGLLFFNLVLLMFVVAIPFTTALVSAYLNHGHAGNVAVALYSAVMFGHAVSFTGFWWWASDHPALLAAHVDPQLARRAVPRFGVGTPIYAAAIALSFFNAKLTLLFHFVLAIVYSFEQLRVERPGAGPGGSAQRRADEPASSAQLRADEPASSAQLRADEPDLLGGK